MKLWVFSDLKDFFLTIFFKNNFNDDDSLELV